MPTIRPPFATSPNSGASPATVPTQPTPSPATSSAATTLPGGDSYTKQPVPGTGTGSADGSADDLRADAAGSGSKSPQEILDMMAQLLPGGSASSNASVQAGSQNSTLAASTSSGAAAASVSSGPDATSDSASTTVTAAPTAIDTTSGYNETYAQELADPTLQATTGTDYTYGASTTNFTLYPNGTPSVSDVQQGSMSDCYLTATLASMAQSNPSSITSAISADPNTPGDYDVKMYDPEGNPVTVTVSDAEIEKSDGSDAGIYGTNGSANWASIMETAYAKYNAVYQTNAASSSAADGIDAIANEGISADAMEAFTGNAATTQAVADFSTSDLGSRLQTSLAAGTPVVADTLVSSAGGTFTTSDGTTFISDHSYSVTGVYQDSSGAYQVQLRNPWGDENAPSLGYSSTDDGAITISLADFQKAFGYLTIGGTASSS